MNPQNIYIGMRYVPKYMGAWDENTEYEPLSIVLGTDGNGYTSKKPVPAGTPTSNTDYWALTGRCNSVIDSVSEKVNSIETNVTQNSQDIEILKNFDKGYKTSKEVGLNGDGATDNSDIFSSLDANTPILLMPGSYLITKTITIPPLVKFSENAEIKYNAPNPGTDFVNVIFSNGFYATNEQTIFHGYIAPKIGTNSISIEPYIDWFKIDNKTTTDIIGWLGSNEYNGTGVIKFNPKAYELDNLNSASPFVPDKDLTLLGNECIFNGATGSPILRSTSVFNASFPDGIMMWGKNKSLICNCDIDGSYSVNNSENIFIGCSFNIKNTQNGDSTFIGCDFIYDEITEISNVNGKFNGCYFENAKFTYTGSGGDILFSNCYFRWHGTEPIIVENAQGTTSSNSNICFSNCIIFVTNDTVEGTEFITLSNDDFCSFTGVTFTNAYRFNKHFKITNTKGSFLTLCNVNAQFCDVKCSYCTGSKLHSLTIEGGENYVNGEFIKNKSLIGFALTGSTTTVSKGSSAPMQLELVKLYSDGTNKNVGAPKEANVRVIGNNSEQTIYNGSGTLRIGSNETAKAIMLTYSGSDSNNMITSMVITIT